MEFPNPAVLTKSATPGEIHTSYAHASIGNKSLDKTVIAFTMAESLKALTMI